MELHRTTHASAIGRLRSLAATRIDGPPTPTLLTEPEPKAYDDDAFFRFDEGEWLYLYDSDPGVDERVSPWGTELDLPVPLAGDFGADQ
jgi:hypothetical protein